MLDQEIQEKIIQTGRQFMKGYQKNDPYEAIFESDQERKLPQPPLVKAPVTPKETWIPLTMDFEQLNLKNDLVSLIRDRRSARTYTQETITLRAFLPALGNTGHQIHPRKIVRNNPYGSVRRSAP